MKGRQVSEQFRQRLEDKQRELFDEYLCAVQSGKRCAGLSEIHKVTRHVADLQRNDWPWVFNWTAAHKALTWMQLNLKFPSGTVKGKAFAFEPWEVFDIATIFGWVSNDDGVTRRFTSVYWQIGRKNGKSTIGGALADFLAFGDGYPGARVYIAASTFDQAGESFIAAADCLREGYFNPYVVVSDTKNNKQINMDGAYIKAITSKPRDGKLPHALLLDEYHEHPTKRLYNSIDSGRIADPSAMMIIITTAGPEVNGVCHQEYDMCKRVLFGVEKSERYWISIYEPDDGDADDSIDTWSKANPNLGTFLTVDSMQDRYDKCKLSADDLMDFRTKNLNRWVIGTTRWANMDAWLAQCCTKVEWSLYSGATCYGGLDLSSTSDFTVFTMIFPKLADEGQAVIKNKYFIPEDKVPQLGRTLGIPLRQWVTDGWVVATPGPIVDYSVVGEYIQRCTVDFDVQLIACDDWKLELFREKVGDWFEPLAVIYGQGMKSMTLPTDRFKEAYLTGQVTADGDPVMTWMMSCAESKTINGNTKLVKPQIDRAKTRIDGVITSIMAYDLCVTHHGSGTDLDITQAFDFW